MRDLFATLFFALALTALGGCGQTGPLYLPDSEVPLPPTVEQANTSGTQSEVPSAEVTE
jgi:predicted small lipoprotein YifL